MGAKLPTEPQVLQFTEGDNHPQIYGLYDETPITGYQFILEYTLPSGTTISKNATITDAANGNFVFPAFLAGELTNGQHRGDIKAIDGLGNIATVQNIYLNVTRRAV